MEKDDRKVFRFQLPNDILSRKKLVLLIKSLRRVISLTKTIKEVVKNDLCTGCGTCVSLCPNSAIRIVRDRKKGTYLPRLDIKKCNECEICWRVCPGNFVNFRELNLEIFAKEPEDILLGNSLNCYSGYSTDYKIRYNSSSGGLISQILIFALEEGIIDGALVTKMDEKNPLEPQPFIAKTANEIISASKSKYCPVPVNVGLKEIMKENGKFAIVGLPCHMHGVRKAEKIVKKLGEKIVLHIGIFCSHTLNFLATEFLLESLGIKKENVRKLSYRGYGWPGMLSVELNDGNQCAARASIHIPFIHFGRMHILHFFIPQRCLMCTDQSCELADISFGDAWLPDFKHDKVGTSVIISRTEKAEKILQLAAQKGEIKLDKLSRNKLVQSQKEVLRFKKKTVKANLALKYSSVGLPSDSLLLEPNLVDYLLSLIFNFNTYVSSKFFLRNLITPLIPFELFLIRALTLIDTNGLVEQVANRPFASVN
jgi:coenzyme F420 hydrogenase subunit beta